MNLSSSCAVEPTPSFPGDSFIRGALPGFTKMYADRCAPEGILMSNLAGHVNNIEFDVSLLEHIPMGRAAKLCNEVVSTALFLLSEQAGYITGQNIVVEGDLVRAP